MKTCSKCKRKLNLKNFNKNNARKDGYQNYCRDCHHSCNRRHYHSHKARIVARASERRKRFRKEVDAFKAGKGCKFCGEKEPCCLDLHHPDPALKKFTISVAVGKKKNLTEILEEAEKCMVMCANCHRKLHAGKLGSSTVPVCSTDFKSGEGMANMFWWVRLPSASAEL